MRSIVIGSLISLTSDAGRDFAVGERCLLVGVLRCFDDCLFIFIYSYSFTSSELTKIIQVTLEPTPAWDIHKARWRLGIWNDFQSAGFVLP